jgi:uncharacterized protein
MMKYLFTTLLLACSLAGAFAQKTKNTSWKGHTVLVYTKNGKGYVHDNIPAATASIQKLGQEHGFAVEVSEDPAIFTTNNLKKYRMLVFASTNNDVFDTDSQRLALRHYIEAGGGLLGVHSAIGTERNWTWFKQLAGGVFAWHPHYQKLTITKIDPQHPSLEGLPQVWQKDDECYFVKEMYPGIHTLLAHDLANIVAKDDKEKDNFEKNRATFGRYYPAAWYQYFDGGLCYMTMLGHNKADYAEPTYVQHLYQAMLYIHQNLGKLNYNKAYAKGINDPLMQ